MKHLRRTTYFRIVAMLIAIIVLSTFTAQTVNAGTVRAGAGLYPDLRTVVPTQLQIVNQQQHIYLRFSNGITNTGNGPLRLRPENYVDPNNTAVTTHAIQEILDAKGNIVLEKIVSDFVFHPAHNHWHMADVALFAVHQGAVNGPIYGNSATKVTFCLIDWYKLDDNAPRPERAYWDCATSYQGISVGWVDQYHMSLEGQDLDITGAPTGRYYFVSTANPQNTFMETDYSNNTAWVAFDLVNDQKGNAKMTIVGNSPCSTPGLCGLTAPNR